MIDKNYYDLLQVNKNASPEIIEKAYKVLAKKYHPDLQPETNKKEAENILKEINEAYEILSNPERRKAYDISFAEQENKDSSSFQSEQKTNTETANNDIKISKEDFMLWQQQELQRKQQMQQLQYEQQLAYQNQLEQARKKAYHDAYIQDLKNRGYKIRYKKSFKDYLTGFITVIVILLVLFLLWQIPFIQNFFIDFCKNNPILQAFPF